MTVNIFQIEVTPTHYRKRWKVSGVWQPWLERERNGSPADKLVEGIIAPLEGRGIRSMSAGGLKRMVVAAYRKS